MSEKKRNPTLHQRLDKIEWVLYNEIKHELKLHRWLLGIILAVGGTLLVALIIKVLVG